MKAKTLSTVAPLYFTWLFILSLAVTLSPLLSHGSALDMEVRPENSTLLYRGDGTSTIQIRVFAPEDFPQGHQAVPDETTSSWSRALRRQGGA